MQNGILPRLQKYLPTPSNKETPLFPDSGVVVLNFATILMANFRNREV